MDEEYPARAPEDAWQLPQILDALFIFVALLTPDGRVRYVNEAPLRRSGLHSDALLGQHLAETPWFAHSDSERERIRRAIRRTAAGETVQDDFNIRRPKPSGDEVTMETTFTPLRDARGRIRGMIVAALDVTERQQQRARVDRLTRVGGERVRRLWAYYRHPMRAGAGGGRDEAAGVTSGGGRGARAGTGGEGDRDRRNPRAEHRAPRGGAAAERGGNGVMAEALARALKR